MTEDIVVEGCETQRTVITFFVNKNPKARWSIDAVWKDNDIVLMRCYISSIAGSRSVLQDGWLARSPEDVKTKRQELRTLMTNKNATIRWTVYAKRPTKVQDLFL